MGREFLILRSASAIRALRAPAVRIVWGDRELLARLPDMPRPGDVIRSGPELERLGESRPLRVLRVEWAIGDRRVTLHAEAM